MDRLEKFESLNFDLSEIKLLSIPAASKLLGINPHQCRKLIRDGVFPHIKLNRSIYIRVSSLRETLEKIELSNLIEREESQPQKN